MTTTTASRNGTFPEDVRSAAELYLLRGFAPIPVPYRAKEPVLSGWTGLRLTVESLPEYFPDGQRRNLGLLTGAPSQGLIDIDLDALEAVVAAPRFLPKTGWVSGRESKRRSHWWYVVADPPNRKAEEFHDISGEMLLELRSTKGQTIVPPSIHDETGEPIVWHEFTEPAQVSLENLRRAVSLTAAAALLARQGFTTPGPSGPGRRLASCWLGGGAGYYLP